MPSAVVLPAPQPTPSGVAKDQDQVAGFGSTSFFSDLYDGGPVIPTGRVNKSRRQRGQQTVPEFSGYNASLEFLSKDFDMVGVVAHKGKPAPASGGNCVAVEQHELDIAMEALPTVFARLLRSSTGSGLHLKTDMWKQAVFDSLRNAIKEVGLINNKCIGNWTVVVICRMGGDGSTKPSWMVTSCSQGNSTAVLLVGEGRDDVSGSPVGGPTCVQLTGNSSCLPEGQDPRLGQFIAQPDQQIRAVLRASAHVKGSTGFSSQRETGILSSMYLAMSEKLPVAGRSAMRQIVESGVKDQCMVLVDLLPFSRLAAEAELGSGTGMRNLVLPFALCGLLPSHDNADALTEASGRRMKTGALASAVLLTAEFE